MTALTIQKPHFAPLGNLAPQLPGAGSNLAELDTGCEAVIGAIGAESELRLRMHALGLIPGRKVRVIRKAAFHGPIQVRSGHTCLLIRLDEARSISLEQPT